jgi:hypothetical protein
MFDSQRVLGWRGREDLRAVVDAQQRNERDARIRAEETRRSACCCSLARAGELGREASRMEF